MASHVHDPVITHERIARQASQVEFKKMFPAIGRGLRNVLLAILTAVGWVIGTVWFVIVYAGLAVYYGILLGAHYQPKAPEPPRTPSLPQ